MLLKLKPENIHSNWNNKHGNWKTNAEKYYFLHLNIGKI